tara:strand:- start:334 stop:537 length:204 start_codon:yes stop_codon:yes gene_type:complete
MYKTYKRETAMLCLVGVFALAFLGMLEALAILAPLTFIFAATAFGADWITKQTNIVGDAPVKAGTNK